MAQPAASAEPGDRWIVALFVLHLVQALALAAAYPHLRYDTDLLAYLVYFRNFVAGDASLHALEFFTVPKPLLVFGLGALQSVPAILFCSAVASAVLGAVVYVVGRDAFGRLVGVVWSLGLLLDVEKATLTCKSKADLWVALFLWGAILLSLRRRFAGASAAVLLSALVKPVTLPCALAFLAVDATWRRRLVRAAVPFAAVPLVLLSNHVLVGSAMGPARYFGTFAALRDGSTVGPGGVLHFALWTQLVTHAFPTTAALGAIGLALWLRRDPARLASPLLLMPLLFLAGYLGLALVSPYAPFFRFFWPVQIGFLGFVLYGTVEVARLATRTSPGLAAAFTAALLLVVARDLVGPLAAYHERLVLPFEQTMTFVERTADVMRRQRREGEAIASPVTFAPYLMWAAGVPGRDVVVGATARRPAWVLYLPEPTDHDASAPLRQMLRRGYRLELTSNGAALLAARAGRP